MDAQQSSFVVIPVSCSHCEEKHLVHVRERRTSQARTGGPSQRGGRQTVECLKCHEGFDVMVAGKIIAGPFRSES
jgi:hypothetical protein